MTLSSRVMEPSAFLETILSPVNTRFAIQRQLDQRNGHRRSVEVVYKNRYLEDSVSDTASLDCSGGDEDQEISKVYEIDPTVGSSRKWSIEPGNLSLKCEEDEIYMARVLMENIDVLVRKINSDTITKAATLFGNFRGGSSTAKVVATRDSNGADVPGLIEKIRFDFMEMAFNGTPIVAGGNEDFYNYFNRMASRCCNTTVGLDLEELFRQNTVLPIYDRKINSLVGSGKMVAFAPGALQLITYNKFRGSSFRAVDTETMKQGVIVDPATDLVFDFYAELQCGAWNFQLSLAHDLVGMPDDMFAAGDDLEGVTWVNEYQITNP